MSYGATIPLPGVTGPEDQADLLEDWHESETGEPEAYDEPHAHAPVDVVVCEPVHVQEFPARTVVSDQVPLDTQAVRRIAPELRTRAQLRVCPRGGDAVIGASSITTGTGFLVKADQVLSIMASDAVYALGVAPGVTMHVFSEVREG